MLRCVVAPYGYGKTSLLLEYAEIMFSFSHVFWVNGQSPCFMRDLDDECIASSCFDCDKDAALVVIDDLPYLDAGRCEGFSREVDRLLEKGCEVLVACEPSCDVMGSLQRDRIRLGPGDLLLDDTEINAARTPAERAQQQASEVPPAQRVPMLVWCGGEEVGADFLMKGFKEDVPGDVLLAMASIVVLGEGSFADLERIGPFDFRFIAQLSRDYPHLGFDEETERFETSPFSIDDVVRALKRRLDKLVPRSPCDDKDELAVLWGGMLLGSGATERACFAIRGFCSRDVRAQWVTDHAYELAERGCFYPGLVVAADARIPHPVIKARKVAFEALCRAMLGEGEAALKLAKRNAFDKNAPYSARVCSLLVAGQFATDDVSAQIGEALELAAASGAPEGEDPSLFWRPLARARAYCAGPFDLLSFWEKACDINVDRRALCILASWTYRAFEQPCTDGSLDTDALALSISPLRKLERFVRMQLGNPEESAPDFFAVSAGLSMEAAFEAGLAREGGPLPTATMLNLRRTELAILDQKRRLEWDANKEAALKHSWASTHPDMMLSTAEPAAPLVAKSVPTLSLKFFGGFDVAIGGVPIEPKRFKRQNVRALLVLMAANMGKELSRRVVCSAMWPDSDPEVARKNFYTIWSQLRRALTLPDGSCPYLVRHRLSCSLEQRYVKSDIMRLNDICRELFFGSPERYVWTELFAEIDRDFSDDLMPNEQDNVLIVEARDRYRSKLVDALVAATDSMTQCGYPQQGIWFARSALGHDDTREDAYAALMRAQMACGQRTAAISTYMTCRRVLAEKLGVDPSPETQALYESLLGIEDGRERWGAA